MPPKTRICEWIWKFWFHCRLSIDVIINWPPLSSPYHMQQLTINHLKSISFREPSEKGRFFIFSTFEWWLTANKIIRIKSKRSRDVVHARTLEFAYRSVASRKWSNNTIFDITFCKWSKKPWTALRQLTVFEEITIIKVCSYRTRPRLCGVREGMV